MLAVQHHEHDFLKEFQALRDSWDKTDREPCRKPGRARHGRKQAVQVVVSAAPLPKDKAATDKLSKLSGSAFDKAFAQHAVMEHEKDIAQFKHEESMTKNSDVKSYAGETLPKLQQHLQLAQTAAQKTGTGAAKQ
jgi:hypothetical protein